MEELDRLLDGLLVVRSQESAQLGNAGRSLVEHCLCDLSLERCKLERPEVVGRRGPPCECVPRRNQPSGDQPRGAAREMPTRASTASFRQLVLPAPEPIHLGREREELA